VPVVPHVTRALSNLKPTSAFRPGMPFYILVLMLRKTAEVSVALMFSATVLFQAWYVPQRQHVSCACAEECVVCHVAAPPGPAPGPSPSVPHVR
jgi:hypothetical protein